MIKKTLCILISVVLAACSTAFTVNADTSYTRDVSVVNGTRYTDYLVIYTAAHGKTTKTNIYGYEVTVTNGIVTKIGANDNEIPAGKNCFVVSGHGVNSDWLKEYVTVGMEVTFDQSAMRVTFTKTQSTALYQLNVSRNMAFEAKQEAFDACLIYDSSADKCLELAEKQYESASDLSEAEILKLAEEYDRIRCLFREREVSEYRGLWVRPDQKNKTQVRNYVKQCYEAGINMLSIETMYSGTLIFPAPKGSYFEQNPIFNGFDVLGAYVDACKEFGIELHCWMPVFYSGSTGNSNYTRSVAYKKPQWRLITNNNSSLYKNEGSGMVFLNPANDEVQDFLAETYTYILENYDIDGFQLDYIRYRDKYGEDDFGYDSVTIEKFKKEYPQYKSSTIRFDTGAAYWKDFVSFRCAQVTKFVERMRAIVDTVAPDVVLTADVGVSVSTSYNSIYQDSLTWLENGWLDMIHPMAYGEGYAPLVKQFVDTAGEYCQVVPGLGVYIENFDAEDMVNQTDSMTAIGCNGVVFFQTAQYFGKNADDALKETLYTEHSIAPALDNSKTVTALMERFSQRAELANERGFIGSSVCNTLKTLSSDAAQKAASDASSAFETLKALQSEIGTLPEGNAKARLQKDVSLAIAASYRSKNDFIPGDVNNDGETDKYDYILVKRSVMGTFTLGSAQKSAADINRDGFVDKYDYILLKRSVMGTYVIK